MGQPGEELRQDLVRGRASCATQIPEVVALRLTCVQSLPRCHEGTVRPSQGPGGQHNFCIEESIVKPQRRGGIYEDSQWVRNRTETWTLDT